jgi:hypothetical protein
VPSIMRSGRHRERIFRKCYDAKVEKPGTGVPAPGVFTSAPYKIRMFNRPMFDGN